MTNILLVAQNENNRIALQALLMARNYVVHVSDNHAGLDQTNLDLVLLDQRLPATDQPDGGLTHANAQMPQGIPLLVVSAADAPLTLDADIHLCEPFSNDDLVASVEALSRVKTRLAALRQRTASAEQKQQELEVFDRKKDDFISFMSHELKNPMASIKGYADLMRRRLSKLPDDPNIKGLEIISQQVVRMTMLLDQLLDFSRINTDRLQLHPSPVDINMLARRTLEMINMMSDQHELELDLPETPLIAEVDQIRIVQAINSLLHNAVKYSPDGSVITVRTMHISNGHGPEVVLSVIDRGIGIPPNDQPYVFGQFFRASNAHNPADGMGLGLFIANGIVARHGGHIDIESEEGQGSTFSIVLPLMST